MKEEKEKRKKNKKNGNKEDCGDFEKIKKRKRREESEKNKQIERKCDWKKEEFVGKRLKVKKREADLSGDVDYDNFCQSIPTEGKKVVQKGQWGDF